MRLKSILTVSFSLLATITVVAAAALVLISSILHRTVEDTAESLESVRLAQGMELRLRDVERTADGVARGAAAAELRQMMPAVWEHIGSEAEAALVRDTETRLKAYLDAIARDGGVTGADGSVREALLFGAAVAGVRELVHMNVEQSARQRAMAVRWDRWAIAGGSTLAGVTVLGVAIVLFWLRATTYRPAVELSAAIDRLASGEHDARAPEQGPAELRNIARQFNLMVEALQRQSRSRLALLAGVAHDLRNPLGALRLASDGFRADEPLPPDDRVRKTFARIHRQVVRLDRMVADFLDASRIEAGVLDLRLELCDLRPLAEAVVDLFGQVAPAHSIVLSTAERPVIARCDPMRVEQVLTNLVSNAIKYSPDGGRVEVSVRSESGAVHVSVSDEGRGISSGDLAHLFEPFRRGGVSQEHIPGVGLGLFVSRRIVEAHGGAIRVDSAPARGARFHVTLPAGNPTLPLS